MMGTKQPFVRLATLLVLGCIVCSAFAADGDWQPVTTELLKTEKPSFSGVCGLFVDHATGDVIININDKGFYRSTDQCKTFTRLSDTQPKGRTESPGCFVIDPTGKSKTIVSALVYGAPVSVSTDEGKTWKMMDAKSGHVDWCAVDWSDPERKFVLAMKHESGGLILLSRDGGKTFTDLGKGYSTAWIFDNETAVLAQRKTKDQAEPKFQRTTDGGKTWKPAGDYVPGGGNADSGAALPKWRDGTLYWLVQGALIASSDKGATWKKLSDVKDGRYGPIFGKDGQHMFVLTGAGVIETADGGVNWSKPLALPKDLKGITALAWIDYDPKHDVLYAMRMTSELYQMKRGGK